MCTDQTAPATPDASLADLILAALAVLIVRDPEPTLSPPLVRLGPGGDYCRDIRPEDLR